MFYFFFGVKLFVPFKFIARITFNEIESKFTSKDMSVPQSLHALNTSQVDKFIAFAISLYRIKYNKNWPNTIAPVNIYQQT